ncbi:MAG: hypothetical protein ACOX8U_00110 [Bradymonadia bacterium]|jgi:hypothetical protein
MRLRNYLLFVALSTLFIPSLLSAQEFSYKGSISTDLRFTIPGNDRPKDVAGFRFDRSDNSVKFTGMFTWGNVDAVADAQLTYSGRSKVNEMRTLQYRDHVDPFYIESDALYLRINDFILDGLDIRAGRQTIDWGSADAFNPTSVISPLDLEDPMDFGRKVANEMISLTYSPGWSVDGENTPIFDELQLQLVWVPLFRSAMVPYSSEYAFSEPNQFRRFAHSKTLHKLVDIQELFLDYGGEVLYNVRVNEPSDSMANSQVGARLSFSLLGVDLSFMGYYGFDHNVQPSTVNVNAVSTLSDVNDALKYYLPYVAGTDSELEQLKGILTNFGNEGKVRSLTGYTDVNLVYPRVWVVGMDMATSLDFLWGTGLWAEVAVTIHDDVKLDVDINGTTINEKQVKKGHFWKAAVGIDNSVTKWLYFNIQYLHGFVDEFGASNLGNYLVAGADIKFFNEQMLLRIFSILQLTEPSAILYPALSFRFWPGTEIAAGALLHFGSNDSKFGNRVVGPNFVYLQGKYSF